MAIESKLTVGKFINMTRPTVQTPRPNANGTFVTQTVTNMTIEESTGVLQKQSNIVEGTGTKVHRNFQWLAYFPGVISNVPLSSDVLTGPMSGCWVVVYSQNGIDSVGHIGTSEQGSPQTAAVKATWHTFANTVGPSKLIGGFNPLNAWPKGTPFPATQSGDGEPDVRGLVTKSNSPIPEMYAVFTYKGDGVKRKSDLRRIADIKKVDSVGPGKLLALFGQPPYLA
jgi:hypothetical protein